MGPTFYDVLGSVRRGRVVYLCLSPEQKRLLRDQDGQMALDVLRHLLGARTERRDPERFPLTEAAVQAVAQKINHHVGQKKSRRLVARLLEAGVVVGAGRSGSPTGTRPSGPGSGSPSSLWAFVPAPLLLSVLSASQVATGGKSVGVGGFTRCSVTSGGYRRGMAGRDLHRMRSLDEVFQSPR